MGEVVIIEKRNLASVFMGLILICMGLAALLTLRDLTSIPDFIEFPLPGFNFQLDVKLLISLLAYPSWFIASIWGEESMVMSIAFLLLGLGFSLLFRKSIKSRLKHR